MYKALFENHLRYSDIVWNALSNIKLSKLQRLQIRARKLIENAKYKDEWNCKWLNAKFISSFDHGAMTFKILHGLYPDNHRHKFAESYMISVYATRNHRDLHIPEARLEYAKRSFYFSDAKNWNEVPDNIREQQSFALKNILENAF